MTRAARITHEASNSRTVGLVHQADAVQPGGSLMDRCRQTVEINT
jgi:hypothetical protein